MGSVEAMLIVKDGLFHSRWTWCLTSVYFSWFCHCRHISRPLPALDESLWAPHCPRSCETNTTWVPIGDLWRRSSARIARCQSALIINPTSISWPPFCSCNLLNCAISLPFIVCYRCLLCPHHHLSVCLCLSARITSIGETQVCSFIIFDTHFGLISSVSCSCIVFFNGGRGLHPLSCCTKLIRVCSMLQNLLAGSIFADS